MTKDTPRDREQTRNYLVKTARKQCRGGLRTNMVEELVTDIMNGGRFIDAVNALVMDTEYWDQ
jgi:hypothetical protein